MQAVLPALGLLAAGGLALDRVPAPWPLSQLLFAAVILALVYGLHYNPKYLHIGIEEDKKYSWLVRIRFVIAGIVFLLGWAWAGSLQQVGMAEGSAVWIAGTTWLARSRVRRHPYRRTRLPLFFFSTDMAMILVLAHFWVPWMWIAAFTAVASHLALAVGSEEGWFEAGIVIAGQVLLVYVARELHWGWKSALIAQAMVLAASLGTAGLVSLARERNRVNVEAALRNLAGFTGFSEAEVRQRWQTSNQTLAENWKRAAPPADDQQALATWYRENSIHYLFASSGFNLRYKQMVFNLDLLLLARGRCLDYGAGAGDLALELARRGHDTVYYDVEGKTMEFSRWRAAQEGLNLAFVSSKEQLRGRGGGFDTIISVDVLEHMPDLPGELDFLCSLLNPGGTIVFNVPAGKTETHPMHLVHRLDVKDYMARRGFVDRKSLRLRWFSSESFRRSAVYVYGKPV
jgi:2-polyprenyl-3-methyl-5-hydroxy-6-metoxy-1,4-benzoquinol methylase